MKSEIIEAIQILADELKRNGKDQTAEFFLEKVAEISSEGDGDRGKFLGALDQLKRSGAIIHYANFTHREEALWDVMHGLVTEFLTWEG